MKSFKTAKPEQLAKIRTMISVAKSIAYTTLITFNDPAENLIHAGNLCYAAEQADKADGLAANTTALSLLSDQYQNLTFATNMLYLASEGFHKEMPFDQLKPLLLHVDELLSDALRAWDNSQNLVEVAA